MAPNQLYKQYEKIGDVSNGQFCVLHNATDLVQRLPTTHNKIVREHLNLFQYTLKCAFDSRSLLSFHNKDDVAAL